MIDFNESSGRRKLLLIGAVAYVLFGLLSFPAHLAVKWFVPDGIRIVNATGTIWFGQAAAVESPYATLSDVKWRARPLALLTAKLSYLIDAKLGDGAIQTTASVSFGGKTRLKDMSGVLPLSALAGIVPVEMFNGRIGLDIEEMVIVDQWISDAHGSVDVVSLQIISPIAAPLGNFELVFAGAADGLLEGRFHEIDGPLTASGTLVLHADGTWAVSGQVKPTAAASTRLSQAVTMLGRRQADGSYQFSVP